MSLLDELANYSSVSSFFSEFTLSTHQLNASASQPLSISNYSRANVKNMPDSISTLQMQYEHYSDGEKIKAGTHKQYYQEYRKKLTKINSMVTLLSAKTRKLKYQFMVHLQRWAKTAERKGLEGQTEDRTKASLPDQQPKSSKNLALVHSILCQMVVISERRTNELMRLGFNQLKANFRILLKAQFLGRMVNEITNNKARFITKDAWNLLKSVQRGTVRAEKDILSRSKPIFLNKKHKASIVKVALDCEPLPYAHLGQQMYYQKLPSLYPQNIAAQSLDYHDHTTLFMEQLSSTSSCMSSTNKKTIDLSFSNNACVSAFEADRESSSQRSFIKQLSDVEMTAVPQSAFNKRKISDFTSFLAEHRTNQNYSHVQIKKPIDSGLNLIKSQVNLHSNDQGANPLVLIFQKDKQRIYHLQREYCLDTFSNEYAEENEEKYSIRRFSYQKERMARSGSDARMSHRQSLGAARAEIDRDYDQEMKKYSMFKQYLQRRRQCTLKGIEKNQKILNKLMLKLEKSKKKVDKLKLQIKPDDNGSKDKQSRVKRLQLAQKMSTPSKSARNSLTSQPKANRNLNITSERTKQRISLHSSPKQQGAKKQQKHQKSMQVYFKYMKEKTIMHSEKATPTKKTQGEENLYSSKKKSAKADSAHRQKNILAISKFPCTKQPRINLKIELGKSESKKTGRGVQKERLKLALGSFPCKTRQRCA